MGPFLKSAHILLHVGGSGDCTVNLINCGIVVRGDMVSIEFAGTGDASLSYLSNRPTAKKAM